MKQSDIGIFGMILGIVVGTGKRICDLLTFVVNCGSYWYLTKTTSLGLRGLGAFRHSDWLAECPAVSFVIM